MYKVIFQIENTTYESFTFKLFLRDPCDTETLGALTVGNADSFVSSIYTKVFTHGSNYFIDITAPTTRSNSFSSTIISSVTFKPFDVCGAISY